MGATTGNSQTAVNLSIEWSWAMILSSEVVEEKNEGGKGVKGNRTVYRMGEGTCKVARRNRLRERKPRQSRRVLE
jgi:hypothetical protein